jgi:hypothetical protein
MTAKADNQSAELVSPEDFRAHQRAGLTQTGRAPVANADNYLSMLQQIHPSAHSEGRVPTFIAGLLDSPLVGPALTMLVPLIILL